MKLIYRYSGSSLISAVLLVSLTMSQANAEDDYVCTYQGRIDKDINGNELPASIMKIEIRGDQADVVETSFSARSENSYEFVDTYDVDINDDIGLILTRKRSGRRDYESKSSFVSVYTIIVNKENGRFTYGYIYDGLNKTRNLVGSCIIN